MELLLRAPPAAGGSAASGRRETHIFKANHPDDAANWLADFQVCRWVLQGLTTCPDLFKSMDSVTPLNNPLISTLWSIQTDSLQELATAAGDSSRFSIWTIADIRLLWEKAFVTVCLVPWHQSKHCLLLDSPCQLSIHTLLRMTTTHWLQSSGTLCRTCGGSSRVQRRQTRWYNTCPSPRLPEWPSGSRTRKMMLSFWGRCTPRLAPPCACTPARLGMLSLPACPVFFPLSVLQYFTCPDSCLPRPKQAV